MASKREVKHAVAVSAPGKVLFAGGFLVLDRQHTGLVFGLNARIHVRIDPPSSESGSDALAIEVRSPQFDEARWCYFVGLDHQGGMKGRIEQVESEEARYTKPNVFVETTLDYTLTYLSHLKGVQLQSFNATILADDDYYSSNPARRRGTFSKFGTTIHDAHKTGLGSSAALVSALVAAVLEFFVEDPGRRDRKSIHNLAQAAHCAAQGKVGSGFDVAAAVYGSCLYRRFTPTVLETLGDRSFAGFGERLHRCVADLDPDQRWDMTISNNAVKIPKSLLLLMCDVDCGSETPGMVRQVLAWRRENSSEASLLWAALQKGQDDLCGELTRLSSQDGLLMSDRENLRDIIQTVRSFVREMSHKSGVPIEPPVITELLDYCTALPGVIGGVAPGAGGYDAVALLVLNDSETIRDLEDRLSKWTSKKKDTQDATIGKVSLLSVRQDHQGVRSEDPARYQEWVTA